MLEQIYSCYYQQASRIKWKELSKTEIANLYVENEQDEDLRDVYFSALVLKYWGKIGKFYTQDKNTGFTIEDCYNWVIDGILIGLNRKDWKNPSQKIFNDKNAVDKIMNRCILSQRATSYYNSNCAKRKINYGENKKSLINTSSYYLPNVNFNYYFIIKKLLTSKNYVSGILIDTLIYDSSCVDLKNNVVYTRIARKLKEENPDRLIKQYSIEDSKIKEQLVLICDKFKQLGESKLITIVTKELEKLKTNSIIKESLCY